MRSGLAWGWHKQRGQTPYGEGTGDCGSPQNVPAPAWLWALGLFKAMSTLIGGLPRWLSDKEPACQCRRRKSLGLTPGSGRSPEVGNGTPIADILAWSIPWAERSLAGHSPWGCKELDTTECLSAYRGIWGNGFSQHLPQMHLSCGIRCHFLRAQVPGCHVI